MGNICLKTKKKRKNKDAIVIEEIEDSNGFEYLKPKGSQYQVNSYVMHIYFRFYKT